jgi:hypothetical protein
MIPEWFVPDLNLHPEGCTCSYCCELRAAVGKMRGLDKHLAAMMAAKEAGQRQRTGCTCNAPYSDDWKAHPPVCPRRAALIAVARQEGVTDVRIGAPESPLKPEEPDPVAQWWEVTRSLVLPDYGHFTRQVPDQPPGACRECRAGPPEPGKTLCWYCTRLGELAREKPRELAQAAVPDNPDRRREEAAITIAAIALCLIITGVFIPHVMSLGILLIGVAVVRAMKS